MRFTKLKWRNLFSYGDYDTELNLDQDGIVFVRGVNKDDESSNGSGKSSVIDVFVWALYGQPLKDLPIEDVKNHHSAGSGVACIEFWVGEDYYEINRYRGDKVYGNGVVIKKNGIQDDTYTDGTNRDVQKQIDSLLGLDYFALTSSIVFSSEIPFKIPRLSPDKRRAHLEAMLGLQAYSGYGKTAKNRMKAVRRTLDDLSIEEREKKSYLVSEKEEIETYSNLSKSFKADKQAAISKLEEELKLVQISIADIDLNRTKSLHDELDALTESVRRKEQLISALFAEITKLTAEQKVIANNKTSAEKEYKSKVTALKKEADSLIKVHKERIKLMEKECPTCERGWEAHDVETHTQVHSKKIDEIEHELLNDINKAMFDRDSAINELSAIEKQISDSVTTKSAEKSSVGEELAELTNEARSIKSILEKAPTMADLNLLNEKANRISEQISTKANETNPYKEIIDSLHIKVSDHLEQLDKMEDKKIDLEEKLKYSTFWDESFNNDGLKLFIFESVIPLLNSRIGHYLPILFDGRKIILTFDKMMNMTVILGGQSTSYGSLSQGERKRVDLAISLALLDTAQAQHGVISNVMFFDELMDSSLDSSGLRAVTEILHSMPVNTIFLMSHRMEISDQFDNVIDIEKDGKFSRILN